MPGHQLIMHQITKTLAKVEFLYFLKNNVQLDAIIVDFTITDIVLLTYEALYFTLPPPP